MSKEKELQDELERYWGQLDRVERMLKWLVTKSTGDIGFIHGLPLAKDVYEKLPRHQRHFGGEVMKYCCDEFKGTQKGEWAAIEYYENEWMVVNERKLPVLRGVKYCLFCGKKLKKK